jgi:hypothetical protein
VASKRGALEWARDHLDPKWRSLLTPAGGSAKDHPHIKQ